MEKLRDMELWSCLLKDMAEPLRYLPGAVLLGLFCVAAAAVFYDAGSRRRTDDTSFAGESRNLRRNFLRILVLFFFLVYLAVMLQLAFFSRPPGSRSAVNLTFLGTWGRSAQGNAYVVENVFLFIPWGILLTLLIRPFQKNGFFCALSGFAASCTLETAQYLTQRGFCQLDDVVMNTLGAFVGWCLTISFLKLSRAFKKNGDKKG